MLDPEAALRGSLNRFSERFRHCELAAQSEGKGLRDYDEPALDAMWERAKASGSATRSLQPLGGERHDRLNRLRAGQEHQQPVDAECVSSAIGHSSLQRRDEPLVDGIDRESGRAPGGLIELESPTLLRGIRELAESVAELDTRTNASNRSAVPSGVSLASEAMDRGQSVTTTGRS